jgi:hypothetical protein
VINPDLAERHQAKVLRGGEVIGDVDDDRTSAISIRDVAGDAAVGEAPEIFSSLAFVVPLVKITEVLIVDEGGSDHLQTINEG